MSTYQSSMACRHAHLCTCVLMELSNITLFNWLLARWTSLPHKVIKRKRMTLESGHKLQNNFYPWNHLSDLKEVAWTMHDKTGEKFKCEDWGYSAHQKSSLNRQKKTAHTDERDFRCKAVGSSYENIDSGTFKRHQLRHKKSLEERFPFLCGFPSCDYRRKQPCELRKHRRSHECSEITSAYKLCPKRYPDRASCYFHNRHAHQLTLFTCPFCDFSASTEKWFGQLWTTWVISILFCKWPDHESRWHRFS